MSVTAVARRYAEAIADVSVDRGLVDQVDSDLRTFVDMMTGSRELRQVFASPVVSMNEKSRVLDALIERTRPERITANLFKTLLRHYRLHHLDAVYEQFRREMNERKGLVLAEVTTAFPIEPGDQTILARRLQDLTGRRVEIKYLTDSSLIGGVVTRIGSVIYDGSVRTQLETVKDRLKRGQGSLD
jgi:F-type H+-transporting ATPase subunit delta